MRDIIFYKDLYEAEDKSQTNHDVLDDYFYMKIEH